jgi:hypothetical protein
MILGVPDINEVIGLASFAGQDGSLNEQGHIPEEYGNSGFQPRGHGPEYGSANCLMQGFRRATLVVEGGMSESVSRGKAETLKC